MITDGGGARHGRCSHGVSIPPGMITDTERAEHAERLALAFQSLQG